MESKCIIMMHFSADEEIEASGALASGGIPPKACPPPQRSVVTIPEGQVVKRTRKHSLPIPLGILGFLRALLPGAGYGCLISSPSL